MSNTIVIGCYGVPGFGGANTSGYALFDMLQRQHIDVAYLNFIDTKGRKFFRNEFGETYGNPRRLANVHNIILNGPLYEPDDTLADFIRAVSPALLVGIGFIAVKIMALVAAGSRILYITTGSAPAKKWLEDNPDQDATALVDMLKSQSSPPAVEGPASTVIHERDAVEIADLVITHCDLAMFLYQQYYAHLRCKILPDSIWFAEWIYEEAIKFPEAKKSFDRREIDVIFVANAWYRQEKNYELATEIIEKIDGLNTCVVGAVEIKYASKSHHYSVSRVANTHHSGLITEPAELFSLMGNSKTVICVSRFDTAPGILFEASALGCNIVTSKNCGNWMICHPDLVVNTYDSDGFLNKVYLSIRKKYDDNIDFFLRKKSFDKLLDVIDQFGDHGVALGIRGNAEEKERSNDRHCY